MLEIILKPFPFPTFIVLKHLLQTVQLCCGPQKRAVLAESSLLCSSFADNIRCMWAHAGVSFMFGMIVYKFRQAELSCICDVAELLFFFLPCGCLVFSLLRCTVEPSLSQVYADGSLCLKPLLCQTSCFYISFKPNYISHAHLVLQ